MFYNQTTLKPALSDLSEIVHAGKKGEEQFRVYVDDSDNGTVKKTYYNMHENQTVEFVKSRVRIIIAKGLAAG